MLMKNFLVIFVALLGISSLKNAHANAGCYCQTGMLSGGLCYVPQGQHNSMRPIGYAICPEQPRPRQEPIDLTPPPILMNQGTFAVALSPSTGAVGASSFAWRDSKTHYHLMAGHGTFALASCIAKTQGQPISSISLEKAEKFVKKHRKKSDCQVIKQSSLTEESLVAILRGKLPNGQYQLFMATRPSNDYLFSQQQPEFQSLLATCQASASDCQIVGQFGDKTEMY